MRGRSGDFPEGDGIHAVTQATGLRAVGEDVPQMSVASIAGGFHPLQKCGPVKAVCHHVSCYRLRKGRPAGTRFELSFGVEESGVATDAAEDAGSVLVPTDAGVRHLGVSLAGNVVGVFAELMEPFAIGLHNLGDGFAAQLLAIVAEVDDSDFAWCAVNFSGIGAGLNCG